MPPHIQKALESEVSTAMLFAEIVGFVGIQGEGITGTQGAGVKTPAAAAVAAAVAGLLKVVQRPKGNMFKKGTKSVIVATGVGQKIPVVGRTERVEGSVPKVHFNKAPEVTKKAIQ